MGQRSAAVRVAIMETVAVAALGGFLLGADPAAAQQTACPATIQPVPGISQRCTLSGSEAMDWDLTAAQLTGLPGCPPDEARLAGAVVEVHGIADTELVCEYDGRNGSYAISRPAPIGRNCTVVTAQGRTAFDCK